MTRTRVFPSAMVLVRVGEKRVRRAERGCLGVGGSAARRGRDRTLAPRGRWQHPGSRAHVKNGRGAARGAARAGVPPQSRPPVHACACQLGAAAEKYCECGGPWRRLYRICTACAARSPTGGGWRRRQRRASATLSRPARGRPSGGDSPAPLLAEVGTRRPTLCPPPTRHGRASAPTAARADGGQSSKN